MCIRDRYHADKKYKEAVTVAVAKCAADTKGHGATLDDLREAVETLEDVERIARRVFGSSHPSAVQIEIELQAARAALRARDTRIGEVSLG